MSEWDYLPTPYESLIESETKNFLLMFLSSCCLIEGKVMTMSDVFCLAQTDKDYDKLVSFAIERTSLEDILRTLLQYEDVRSQKRQEKVLEIIKDYVRRHGKENL